MTQPNSRKGLPIDPMGMVLGTTISLAATALGSYTLGIGVLTAQQGGVIASLFVPVVEAGLFYLTKGSSPLTNFQKGVLAGSTLFAFAWTAIETVNGELFQPLHPDFMPQPIGPVYET